jgi:dienelactone hydrolase
VRPLLALLALVVPVFADSKGGKEADLRKAIAGGLVELAAWCQLKKLVAEGRGFAQEALGVEPGNAKAKELAEALAGDSGAGDPERRELEAKKAAYGKKLGALYRELSKEKHAAKEDAAFDGFLIRGWEWDPKTVGPALEAEWKAAYGKRDYDRAHRLISALERAGRDPARAKALKDCELKVAEREPVVKKATAHDMEYYLVLPKDWTPAKTWPVLVYVEGAGSGFRNACKNYGDSRGDFNAIVVTPQTFGSTNALAPQTAKYTYKPELVLAHDADHGKRMKFDEEGLLCVLADLRKEYNAEEKIYITGFSGGGNLTWRMVFGHPDKLHAAAPACPNFAGAGDLSTAPERESLPVRCFQGDKDEHLNTMLEAQWKKAKEIADANGWKDVTREMLPGVGHSPCVKEVLKYFAACRAKK